MSGNQVKFMSSGNGNVMTMRSASGISMVNGMVFMGKGLNMINGVVFFDGVPVQPGPEETREYKGEAIKQFNTLAVQNGDKNELTYSKWGACKLAVKQGSDVHVEEYFGEASFAEGVYGNIVSRSDVGGELKVRGKANRVKFDSVSGSMEVIADCATVNAHTVSGGLDMDGNVGSVDFHSVSGSLSFRGQVDDATFKTVSGNIDIDGKGQGSARTVSGRIRSRGGFELN